MSDHGHVEHANEKDPRDVDLPPKAWRDDSWHAVAGNHARGIFVITMIMTVAYCGAVIYVIFS
jgi:hypothetical protein